MLGQPLIIDLRNEAQDDGFVALREFVASCITNETISVRLEDFPVPIEFPTIVAATPRQKHPPKPPRNPFKAAQAKR